MDGDQNGINNVETIKCKHCGTLNNKTNKFCMNCGTAINENDSSNQAPTKKQQVNNVQPPQKEKNEYKGLMILLGIVSIALITSNQSIGMLVFIVAIASLFNKKTRDYGLTILLPVGIALAISIILFGMCFAVLSVL